jgi:hypothetical protein
VSETSYSANIETVTTQTTSSGINSCTTKQVAISTNEAMMTILSKVADPASWNPLAIMLAVSVFIGGVVFYMSRKQLFTVTKERIAQVKQLLGRTRPQLDYGHEKNHCEYCVGGFVAVLKCRQMVNWEMTRFNEATQSKSTIRHPLPGTQRIIRINAPISL